MAYIYRYGLEDERLNDYINFKKYNWDDIQGESILNIMENIFNLEIKSYNIGSHIIEFRSYYSLDRIVLNRFIEYIVKNHNDLINDIDKISIKKDIKIFNYFKRYINQYYGFVINSPDSRYINLELIDIEDFSKKNIEYYTEKNKELFYKNKNNRLTKDNINNPTAIYRLFNMDILTGRINKKDLDKFYWDWKDLEDGDIIKISGHHNSILDIESEFNNIMDIMIKNEFDIMVNSEMDIIREIDSDFSDNKLIIMEYESIDIEKKEYLRKIFDIGIKELESNSFNSSLLDINREKRFILYNVSHGLATSISDKFNRPILFFDIGFIKKNKDIKNDISKIDLSRLELIILSHIHKDHWRGVLYNDQLAKVDWIIADQNYNLVFLKLISAIYYIGLDYNININTVNQDINIDNNILISARVNSKKDNSRYPGDLKDDNIYHQNGLALLVRLKKENNREYKILIPGDQEYDFIEDKYLEDLDILVATHHGGSYTWSYPNNRFYKYRDIPRNTQDGLIIYSYGNIYDNPSRETDYKRQGWLRSFKTYKDDIFIL